ncbi:MAG: hypothetical protein LUJ25_09420 [Firmicutes bacterium]|nr:hypothetical protein [Bacillota bacterium]
MKRSDIIKCMAYFLLFALILYIEKDMIDMQVGSGMDDKDRSGGIGFMNGILLMCVVPFYILYDVALHKMAYRLLALLLQAAFGLWSLWWFMELLPLRYEVKQGLSASGGLMPVSGNNFYECWIVGYGVILYLAVAMIVSYVWKQYSSRQRTEQSGTPPDVINL